MQQPNHKWNSFGVLLHCQQLLIIFEFSDKQKETFRSRTVPVHDAFSRLSVALSQEELEFSPCSSQNQHNRPWMLVFIQNATYPFKLSVVTDTSSWYVFGSLQCINLFESAKICASPRPKIFGVPLKLEKWHGIKVRAKLARFWRKVYG